MGAGSSVTSAVRAKATHVLRDLSRDGSLEPDDENGEASGDTQLRASLQSVIHDEEAEVAAAAAIPTEVSVRSRLRGAARTQRPEKAQEKLSDGFFVSEKVEKLMRGSTELRLRRRMYFSEPRALELSVDQFADDDDDEEEEGDEDEDEDDDDDESGSDRPETPNRNQRRSRSERVEDERLEALAAAKSKEDERKRRLCKTANGDRLWMRARPMRANLALAPPERLAVASGGQRWVWLQQLPAVERADMQRPYNVWYMAPAIAQLPRDKIWCWRGDFVEDARLAAETSGLSMAVVDGEVAEHIRRKTGHTIPALQTHVEVTATDGKRQLWSPTFIGLLDMLRAKRRLGDSVRQTEREVLDSIEGTTGFRADSWQDLTAEAIPDRAADLRSAQLRQARLLTKPAPSLPRIPPQLGQRQMYKQTTSWSREPWAQDELPRLNYSASGNLHLLSDAEISRWDRTQRSQRPLRKERSAPNLRL